jgi:hypothetical protein
MIVLSVCWAMTGCNEVPTLAPPGPPTPVLSWETFRASVYQEPDTGLFIVDGDTPVSGEEELRGFYDRLAATWRSPVPEAELSTSREPLVIARVGSADDRWPDGVQLTYCISTTFGSNYGAVVAAMRQAASEWNSTANINFVHRSELDGSCNESTPNVVFDVSPTSGAPYVARAFFPRQPRPFRNVLIETAYLPTGTGDPPLGMAPWTLVGVLRHELGHALGFRHEHVRPEAGTCFEGGDWRSLTPYDSASVMHYPQCNGTQRGDLALTALDAAGALAVYGPRLPAGPRWSTAVANLPVGDFATWSRAPGVRAIDGDFNRDGLGDVALVGVAGWTTIPVAFGNGTGGFSITNLSLPSFASWAAAATHVLGGDFDGDGRTDLALLARGWTTIPIAHSNGDGTFRVTNAGAPSFAALVQVGARAVAGDFDGDGDGDIVLTGVVGWTTIPMALSNRDGTFRITNESSPAFAGWATTPGAQLASGDFDGDADADLALVAAGWTTVPVAFSQRNGSFRITNARVAGFPDWSSAPGAKLVAGDFDSDGDADLAIPGGNGWMSVPFALSTRDGGFEVANFLVRDFPAWATGARFVLARTVDANGSADIVLVGGDGWTTMPVLFSNISFRSSTVANPTAGEFATWSQAPGVRAIDGDFNRDGRGDIALFGARGWTTVPIASGDGSGGFSFTNLSLDAFPAWAAAASSIVGGDFDGDGDTDVALLAEGWTTVPIAFSNSDGTFRVTNSGAPDFTRVMRSDALALSGDFDGDGDGDIALLQPGDDLSAIQLAFSNRDGTFRTVRSPTGARVGVGESRAPAVAADFDGDGDDDIAVASNAAFSGLRGNGVSLALSSRDGNFSKATVPLVGMDIPRWAVEPGARFIAGDFNGDGAADLAFPGVAAGGSVPIALSVRRGTSGVREFRGDHLYWPHVFPTWVAGARFVLARRMDADRSTDLVLVGGTGWTSLPILFVRP